MKRYFLVTLLAIFVAAVAAQDKPAAQEELQKTSAQTVKLFREKKYGEALPLAEKAAAIAEQIYGNKNVETINALKNLGYVYFYNGDRKKAEKVFDQIFDAYRAMPNLSESDLSSAAAIAETLASLQPPKELNSAEKYYRQSIAWREQSGGGKNTAKLVTPLTGLANINFWKKDYNQSAELYRKAIEINFADATTNKTDSLILYLRGECAFRKADKVDEFALIEKKFPRSSAGDSSANNDSLTPSVINAGMINGKALDLTIPNYPAEAKQTGATGEVVVEVLVDEKGDVISACAVKNANLSLAESSETAAYSSKFKPTTLNGKLVKVRGTLIYKFNR